MTTTMSLPHETTHAAREAVWEALRRERAARFPFPTRGRIPHFAGAEHAARRLLDQPRFDRARRIVVNPDAPQRPVRVAAMRRGIVVYVPMPHRRAGFMRLDPARIPEERLAEAAMLSRMERWAEEVPLADLPPMGLIVVGSVAVTRDGKRCGNVRGFADLAYAILRELGHPPVDVVTTVHPLQIVADFPAEPHDLPVTLIVTPDEAIEVASPRPAPPGITWSLLTRRDFEHMPILRELATLRGIGLREP